MRVGFGMALLLDQKRRTKHALNLLFFIFLFSSFSAAFGSTSQASSDGGSEFQRSSKKRYWYCAHYGALVRIGKWNVFVHALRFYIYVMIIVDLFSLQGIWNGESNFSCWTISSQSCVLQQGIFSFGHLECVATWSRRLARSNCLKLKSDKIFLY